MQVLKVMWGYSKKAILARNWTCIVADIAQSP